MPRIQAFNLGYAHGLLDQPLTIVPENIRRDLDQLKLYIQGYEDGLLDRNKLPPTGIQLRDAVISYLRITGVLEKDSEEDFEKRVQDEIDRDKLMRERILEAELDSLIKKE